MRAARPRGPGDRQAPCRREDVAALRGGCRRDRLLGGGQHLLQRRAVPKRLLLVLVVHARLAHHNEAAHREAVALEVRLLDVLGLLGVLPDLREGVEEGEDAALGELPAVQRLEEGLLLVQVDLARPVRGVVCVHLLRDVLVQHVHQPHANGLKLVLFLVQSLGLCTAQLSPGPAGAQHHGRPGSEQRVTRDGGLRSGAGQRQQRGTRHVAGLGTLRLGDGGHGGGRGRGAAADEGSDGHACDAGQKRGGARKCRA
mmetsp:Transcript_4726/g.11836  ORF Transcript_4726/g.11836 Transcript_4726/m.11836 type:complete len:256 (-) Transcript_4726:66-833(-)